MQKRGLVMEIRIVIQNKKGLQLEYFSWMVIKFEIIMASKHEQFISNDTQNIVNNSVPKSGYVTQSVMVI